MVHRLTGTHPNHTTAAPLNFVEEYPDSATAWFAVVNLLVTGTWD